MQVNLPILNSKLTIYEMNESNKYIALHKTTPDTA